MNLNEPNTKTNIKEEPPRQNIIAYIFIQNNPVGEEPIISVTFPISLRIFCMALALSHLENQNNQENDEDEDDDDNDDE